MIQATKQLHLTRNAICHMLLKTALDAHFASAFVQSSTASRWSQGKRPTSQDEEFHWAPLRLQVAAARNTNIFVFLFCELFISL
eukprot:m.5505 g.5505  ORF g.5505 m.5505 type:complete len:84 (+) comp13357_c0_seq1:2948-3199(+)